MAVGVKKLPSLLTFGHSELAEEIFIDFPEGISLDVHRDGGHDFKKLKISVSRCFTGWIYLLISSGKSEFVNYLIIGSIADFFVRQY
jgi:hypothetical protein